MEKQEIIKNIHACALFADLDDILLGRLAHNATLLSFVKGERLPQMNGISIISSGKCGVYSLQDDKKRLLNILNTTDCFGFASMYSESDKHSTEIIAKSKAEIIFLPTPIIEETAEKEGRFALKIIRLLSEKIRFLNARIYSYLSTSVQDRVMKYLHECNVDEEGYVIIEEKMTSVSDRLGIGRASLYRVLSSLEKSGSIVRDKNRIKTVK